MRSLTVSIDLAYSDGVIDEAGWLELELAYSDLEINLSECFLWRASIPNCWAKKPVESLPKACL